MLPHLLQIDETHEANVPQQTLRKGAFVDVQCGGIRQHLQCYVTQQDEHAQRQQDDKEGTHRTLEVATRGQRHKG